ncbi:MAG TPA: hypothetical protein VF382_06935, partial [Actinomycetota bacterium]
MRLRTPLVLLLGLLLGLLSAAPDGMASAETPSKEDGIAFTAWWWTTYKGEAPERAMANLADTGAGWVSILTTWYQDDYRSTRIYPTANSPRDPGIAHMIRTAHRLGLKVMLKPHVDLAHDSNHWRGDIGTGWAGQQRKWNAWFASYKRFIWHEAELAAANGVEQFSVGCELQGTSSKSTRWRKVIAGVRERFTGTVIYASNWGGEETGLTWWDAVDLIGVDAYYPLTDDNDPSLEDLAAAWSPYADGLSDLAERWDKPIVLTEIGYRSIDGANRWPWDWQRTAPIDLQEQSDCYKAALETFWDESWFGGMFWWDWSADPTYGGPENDGYTPFGKPVEDVLRTWYRAT